MTFNWQDRILKSNKALKKIQDKKLDPKTFCLVPFSTIILEPNGYVGTCRLKGTEFSLLGNLKDQNLKEIWNGEFARGWRKEILRGENPKCTKEIKDTRCNLCSENNTLLDDVELSEIQTRPILKLVANLNGHCNLQCIMCDIWEMPNGFYDEQNFWIPARENLFPYLKEMDMLSGEPFIQKDTFRLIDEVTSLNKKCLWNFTTNLQWHFGQKIKNALDKIEIKTIVYSIDGISKNTYEKIRKKGRFDLILKNLDKLKNYFDNRSEKGCYTTKQNMNFLVQKDNWREIPYIFDFLQDRNIYPFISLLYRPHEYSLLDLDLKQRLKILDYLTNQTDKKYYGHILRVTRPLIDSLPNIDKAKYLLEYVSDN